MRISKPKPGEPIRLVTTKTGHRYRAVVDTGTRPDGTRRQATKTLRTLGEARDWVTDTRAAVNLGTYQAPDALTLDGLCTRWLASKRDVREITRRGYETVLKPVRGRMGHRKAQDLTRADIEGLVDWLASDEGGQRGKGVSRRTIVYTLQTLRQVLDHGVSEGLLRSNAAQHVKPPRKALGDTRVAEVWTRAEFLRFRDAADVDDWAAGWRLVLCGLRRSEVLGMTWAAVDLDAGTVEIRQARVSIDGKQTVTDSPKSDASHRTVPVESMHPGTVAIFRALSTQQARERLAAGPAYQGSGYVLVDALGSPVRPEAFSDRFAAVCAEAGVPKIRMHNVRHSLALMAHEAGQAPASMAALLGHSVAVHLSTYVPATEAGARAAAGSIGRLLSEAI
ncbi:tyrosine-type recombinase/integrase [Ruania halotolerans]|uniref:tyrosine-type recombinase/integrase n=1 Tax=Ruania halotolerans TaxID=2897773 RepID=UPI001E4188C5|nr:tyrosine-type recombinase/integrase [Ruania halotolerans]UFU06990.1 site-specific integrase [Ruania halotolerans]